MPLNMGYSAGGNGDTQLMTAGIHQAVISDLRMVPNNFEPEKGDQLKITFEALQAGANGKKPIISLYTAPRYGDTRSKLTTLINKIYGRSLTQQEALALDLDNLRGITGQVIVEAHTKKDGSPTAKFISFMVDQQGQPAVPVPQAQNYAQPSGQPGGMPQAAPQAYQPAPQIQQPAGPVQEAPNPWNTAPAAAPVPHAPNTQF